MTALRLPITVTAVAVLLMFGGLQGATSGSAVAQNLRAVQPPSSKFDETLVVQRLLYSAGFAAGEIDGQMTQQTREAIRSFQRQNAMRVDGRVTLSLMTFLSSYVLDNIPDGDTAVVIEASNDGDSSIDLSSRANMALVQRMLTRHGLAPGRIDGVETALTEQAIRNFEARIGLPVTGEVSLQLISALGEFDELAREFATSDSR